MHGQSDERTVVALLPDAQTVSRCLTWARAAAAAVGGTVSAFHVGANPAVAFLPPEELDIRRLINPSGAGGAAADRAVRAAFDGWVAEAEPPAAIAWASGEGDMGRAVAAATRRAALVAMAPPASLGGRDALHGVLFWSHRPVLLAPPGDRPVPKPFGRRILVAWKPGPAVERAVTAARPWLDRADRVTVVSVCRPGDDSYAASARAFFAAIGCDADIRRVDRRGGSVGRQLVTEAETLDADAMVLGAFHHGEIWEAILGGVTRDILDAPVRPALIMAC